MSRFFDPSPPVLSPCHIVTAFTGSTEEELRLPRRAIVTFSDADVRWVLGHTKGSLIEKWSPFKQLYFLEGSRTLLTRSQLGGPGIAALVEELSAFGVEEFILWGYCGAIDRGLRIGDVLIARGALREDGVSYHYMEKDETLVFSDWSEAWLPLAKAAGFREALIWTCDAIYRETASKVARYRDMGIGAVEMEVSSFYSVCNFKGLKGIAFLVVSDLLTDDAWHGGFHSKPFREGARRLSRFLLERAIHSS